MTKKQFKIKFRALSKELKPYIQNKAEELLNSGAVDLKSYENDYRLPKIFLCTILERASTEYRPFHPIDRKEVENLSHF